jgi:hypothetical protein
MSGIFVARHRFGPYCTVVSASLDALIWGLSEHALKRGGKLNFDDLLLTYHPNDDDWVVIVNTVPDRDTPIVAGGGKRRQVYSSHLAAAARRVAATGIPTHHWM